MAKVKKAKAHHGDPAHDGHADHGHGHDDHAHDAHEPPPPPEPETPLWFTMLGGVLFVAAALAALVLAGDDADPANPDSARKPSAVAVPPNGAEGDSAAQGNAAPRGVPPVRRLQPGDFEKKRLGPAAK